MVDAAELLRRYADERSETAFHELVIRYIDFVYSTALRRVCGDSHLAQDVVQTVFTDLARKAGSLAQGVRLGGWLHRHTGFVASNLIRARQRRQAREREAVEMNSLHLPADADWKQIAPVLD